MSLPWAHLHGRGTSKSRPLRQRSFAWGKDGPCRPLFDAPAAHPDWLEALDCRRVHRCRTRPLPETGPDHNKHHRRSADTSGCKKTTSTRQHHYLISGTASHYAHRILWGGNAHQHPLRLPHHLVSHCRCRKRRGKCPGVLARPPWRSRTTAGSNYFGGTEIIL